MEKGLLGLTYMHNSLCLLYWAKRRVVLQLAHMTRQLAWVAQMTKYIINMLTLLQITYVII